MAYIKKDVDKHTLFAIVRYPDGSLRKVPVKKETQTIKKYDAYVKSMQGIYVPNSMRQYLKQNPGRTTA